MMRTTNPTCRPGRAGPIRLLRFPTGYRHLPLVPGLVLLLLAISASGVARAQELRLFDVTQEVTIGSNGTMEVVDTRTFSVSSGDFGEAFLCLRPAQGQSVALLSGTEVVAGPGGGEPFTQPCVDGPGTEVGVRLPSRVQEARVRFHYRVEGAVTAYGDVVEWYHEIYPREQPAARGYSLIVNAPGSMEAPYDAFVHVLGSAAQPVVRLSEDRSTLTVELESVPESGGVEIRYLMDPSLFEVTGSESGLERILREEARLAGIGAARRHPAWGVLAALALLLLAIGVWRAYRRHGEEPAIETMRYPFEPPSDLPPAAVAVLQEQRFAGGSTGAAFQATIMDLARRGWATFAGEGKEFAMRFTPAQDAPDRSELQPFEEEVLDYLRVAAAGRDPDFLEFKELKRYSQKHASTFIANWGKEVRSWVEDHFGGRLTKPESRRASVRWGIIGILLTVLQFIGAGLTLGANGGMFIVCGILSAFIALAAFVALPSWRPEVAGEVYGWQGFRRTLKDYTRMKDAPDDFFVLWDRYYCYAAALGVAERFLRNLRRAMPERKLESSFAPRAAWLGSAAASSGDIGAATRSIASLSSALSQASASASSGGSISGGGGSSSAGGSAGVR